MTSYCTHCSTKYNNKSQENGFCCKGCEVAYSIIHSMDLGKYYKMCKDLYGITPSRISDYKNNIDYALNIRSNKNGTCNTEVLVEGIRCGSCVWLIESFLAKYKDIIEARINMTTHVLKLQWYSSDEMMLNSIITQLQKLGYRAIPYTKHNVQQSLEHKMHELLKAISIAGLGMMQVMMLVICVWVGNTYESINDSTRYMLHIISGIISIPCVIYCGLTFFKSALTALRNKFLNMDIAISFSVIITLGISIQETIFGGLYTYYDSSLMLIFVLLIGRYIELKTSNHVYSQVHEILLKHPNAAIVETDDNTILLKSTELVEKGEIVIVSTGEAIPVDGVVIAGSSSIDISAITGETAPQNIMEGSAVMAGCINLGSSIKVRCTSIVENSAMYELTQLIEQISQSKTRFTSLSEKLAKLYTPFVLFIAFMIFILKLLFGFDIKDAALTMACVLLVTCPCAIAIAVPVAHTAAITRSIKQGIFLKNADALEKLNDIKNIFLDKTGTITTGNMHLINKKEVLASGFADIIFSMCNQSQHSISRTIARALQEDCKIVDGILVHDVPGIGLVSNDGRYTIMRSYINNNTDVMHNTYGCYSQSTVFCDYETHTSIYITCTDKLRDNAAKAVHELKKLGKKVIILSGDTEHNVSTIAYNLSVHSYHSNMLPKAKYEIVSSYKSKSLMVGDGLNDLAAMKQAHVCAAMSCGVKISQKNADIVINSQDMMALVELFKIATKTKRVSMQNISVSLVYNLALIPIAAFGALTPFIAALSMSASSLYVILNATRI